MNKISDKELYSMCKKYGAESLSARWKFIGLIPEVARREISAKAKGKSWLERRGYQGVHMFAAKLAGVSRDQVNLVLRLDRRFEDLPLLRFSLVKGEVSINKLFRIASIATKENQKELLEKVKTLSKAAIEIYVKEQKNENQNGLQMTNSEQKAVPGHCEAETIITNVNFMNYEATKESLFQITQQNTQKSQSLVHVSRLKLDADLETQLLELQEKGININNLLRKFLKQREEKIQQEMVDTRREVQSQESEKAAIGLPIGRHIKIKIKDLLQHQFGTKCGEPGCRKQAAHIHHERPFSKYHTHDPFYLKPLCKGHHELQHAHNKNIQKFRQLAIIS